MQSELTHNTPQKKSPTRAQLNAILLEARDWLLNSVSGMVPRYEDAEDIVQDVFYQFTVGYSQLRSLEAASAWMYRTARNRVSDFYRKKARTVEGSHAEVQATAGEEGQFLENLLQDQELHSDLLLDQEHLADMLEAAIESLPELQREVFIWHEVEDFSYREIAEMTGVSINTLLSRKRYAVQALQKKLQEFRR